ncbi:glycosyltransferase family 24 protein [Sclerotinia borealis F-4128]|uniref:Glycosyltransferase family 24 protein n=1 Tax=Sclerotinia borealis (strain F-4128) TaxID=1432307 RepID=W9CM90_SCLBF|nr:glycosyltransferase family 24 protein [Sclerotinia borealis F-4128]
MGGFNLPWGLSGALLASTYLHSICVTASPSINVGLQTSFPSAPYLLELLETAATENASSYFPLLDRIADDYFSKATTDKDLYDRFMQILNEDGHMDAEALSSYQLALSMRVAAPRIEAQFQYYHTAVEASVKSEKDSSCPTWVLFDGYQYCSPSLDEPHGVVTGDSQTQELPFDYVLGNPTGPHSILYADITSSTFGQFHKTLAKTARESKTSYRLRHRRAIDSDPKKPLMIPGYGVELALKRTDYIVIDDRKDDDEKAPPSNTETKVKFEDEEVADLKPLSTSELSSLGLKASSFIMQSDKPFDSLIKLSQDFPKHSSAIASHNVSSDFLAEHNYNRGKLVPAGFNIWWMNGVQMIDRQIDAISMLDILRKERRLINGVRDLGFTGPEAVQLLSHSDISGAKSDGDVQRFDWRDEIEGGSVIMWLNDIEKDKRYADFPATLGALLQRTYPGQLPSVRKEIFNLVIPIDFSVLEDITLVAETLANFVKRKLVLHIGLVPITTSPAASEQAKVLYHLLDVYGLSGAIAYLEASVTNGAASPAEKVFEAANEGREVRAGKVAIPLKDLLKSDHSNDRIDASSRWTSRLSANGDFPPIFVNGVALSRDENWLQAMVQRLTADLQIIQQGVFNEIFTQDSYIPEFFLSQATARRNALIVPESDKNLKIIDITTISKKHGDVLIRLPKIGVDLTSPKEDWAHMVLIADLSSVSGLDLLLSAAKFRESVPALEITIIHNPSSEKETSDFSTHLFSHINKRSDEASVDAQDLFSLVSPEGLELDHTTKESAQTYWKMAIPLIRSVALSPGENGILLNGRFVGPIPVGSELNQEDFQQLLSYERTKRIAPVYAALKVLGLSDNIADPLAGAKISSIVALSSVSDTPDGIFEQAPTNRISTFDIWNSSYTVIEAGDALTATIHMTVVIDPVSEQGQKWVPIVKAISELEGVYLKMFLNPKERLQELPIKRFYRYVLESKPTFDDEGALVAPGASFTGVPQEALLTVKLDIPPAWLVAPKVSIQDPDNIKLSSIKSDVDALYELEHILIEGHSRDMPSGSPPRGAQLILGTEKDSHFADTIIMSNLGYFQFKANPGFYKIDLQRGRSSEIFKIDSIGSKGWAPVPGDESTEVVLMSFQGATLYPRLSRKPGMEGEDVLEAKIDSPMDYVSRGLNFAQGILGSKAKADTGVEEQADINIFSVASGHLYERMLNIMMVSVMKNTKHTVKFWFIEQFLSPSFKDFIPHLATEYGFKYEMVTYKWPHWLRGQTEKQREIWGYKILFLDVLFPLSLDKVIFVDADQIVRTDMIELVNHDLQGAPYGFTPMCDSRTEMEGFRFWKQGYWEKFLRGLPYHISALYVVDLRRFRQIAAGDRLRQQYQSLSADPNSLSNLDQDLPNHMQQVLPIHSLPQEWLWCETWCSDESLKEARTIDLCNNPLTKEPKLDRARRQVPEWTVYDDEIAAVDRKRKGANGYGTDDGNGDAKNTKSRTLEEMVNTKTKKDEL